MNGSNKDKNCVGRVIRILNKKSVVISATSNDVKVGDVLSVYQVSDEIYDLDGNSLGPMIFDKDKLVVKQTTEHYSLCEKKDFIIQRSRALFGMSKALSALATSPLLEGYEEEENPLHVNEEDIQPLDIELDPVIHLGDPVRILPN